MNYRPEPARRAAVLRAFVVSIMTALMATGVTISAAWALDPADVDNAAREAARIQREQQLQQQQQFELDRSSTRAPAQLPAPAIKPVKPADKGGCRQIDAIQLAGASHLDTFRKKRLIQPYLGRCLGVGDIEALLADVTRAYISRGMISSRAYIPPQDLSRGALEVLVIEGRVQDLRQEARPARSTANNADADTQNSSIKDSEKASRTLYLSNLFPGVIGEPLNLRDIEQGLDQSNRLASNNVTMDIRSGDEPGDSVVVIYNQPSKPWHGNVSADNLGTRATGREQAAVSLSLDSPLGINDFISVTRRQAVPDKDGRGSSSENYSYVLPWGYATFSLGASNSRYESTLHTAGGSDLQSSGESQLAFFRGDYVAWRGQTGRLGLYASLTGKENKSWLAGQFLGVSSRRLTVLEVGGSFSMGVAGGVLALDAGLSRGLHAFGAMADPPGLPEDAPRAQFRKYSYGASYFHPFQLAGLDVNASTQFSGQHAKDALYGTEQISIGGMFSVRGFYDQSLAGDEGYYLRNDLSLQKPLGRVLGKMVVLKPYLAVDGGDVHSLAQGTPSGTLVGAAVGASLLSGPVFFDALIGHPLYQADAITEKRGANAALRFSCLF